MSLAELAKQADRFDAAALSQDIVILEELRRHVRQSQAGRALLDATLVRMTLADQFSSISELLERVTGGGSDVQKKKSEPLAASRREPAASLASPTPVSPPPAISKPAESPAPQVQTPTVQQAIITEEDPDEDDDLPAPGKVWDGPRESLGALMKKQAAAYKPEVSNVEPVRAGDLSEHWSAMIGLLAEQGPAARPASTRPFHRYRRRPCGHPLRAAARNFCQTARAQRQKRSGSRRTVQGDAAAGRYPFRSVQRRRRSHVTGNNGLTGACSDQPFKAQCAAAPTLPAAPPPMMPETSNSIRLTEEIRSNLYKSDPLIRAVVEQLGGSIVKFEE